MCTHCMATTMWPTTTKTSTKGERARVRKTYTYGVCHYDNINLNPVRIDALNSADFSLPIYELGLEDIVRAACGRNLFFTTDIDKGIEEADLIFVSVNTTVK